MSRQPKVAIIHDWLVGGGAEKVVLALHEMYPNAPIYTSYCTDEWRKKLGGKVITGYLQYWPFSALRKFLPVLRIMWFSHLDLSEYDMVISSTGNGEAFGIKTFGGTKHICYCHTPTHFYWRHYEQYIEKPGFGFLDPIARIGLKLLVSPLRAWDKKAAQRPDTFVANSTHIQKDIKKYYGRDAVVIHPPVDVERFSRRTGTERKGLIVVGRQVPQKKIELAILACNHTGTSLTVVGNGPDHRNLVKKAGPSIRFVANASDTEVATLMSGAAGFVFTSEDDFGITPIEALASGTPVIAYRGGGALDYISPGENGVFFKSQTVASLISAIDEFRRTKFDTSDVKKSAQDFSVERFKKEFQKLINEI